MLPPIDMPEAHAGRGSRTAVWPCVALLAILAAVGAPDAASGQAVQPLDDATYRVRLDDAPAARERFALRREGNVVKAVGRLTGEGAGTAPAGVPFELLLQTDAAYRPQFFQLRSNGSADVVGQRSGDRFRVRIATDRGDRWTEHVASPDISVLEPRLAHHYQLLLRQHREALSASGRFSGTAVVPSRGERCPLVIRRIEGERAAAGGRASDAYEFRIGSVTARVWADGEGRVWRVEIPELSWVATRTEEGT